MKEAPYFIKPIGWLGSTLSAVIAPQVGRMIERSSPENALVTPFIYNSGDFFIGYSANFLIDTFLSVKMPTVSERWRKTISTTFGVGIIVVAETVQLPFNLLGTPEPTLKEIIPGILGVASSLGVNIWADRLMKKAEIGDSSIKSNATISA